MINSMRNGKKRITHILLHIFLLASIVITCFPILYTIISSFKTKEEFLLGGAVFLPRIWQWKNYVIAWEMANFARYTYNSLVMSFGAVIGSILVCTTAGFTLARLDFPGKKVILSMLSLTMFISGVVIVFPVFKLSTALGLTNSLWGVIIVEVAFGMVIGIFLVMNYCIGIAKEMDEAAVIDGCSFIRIYWNIIMPVIKPIIATLGILQFRATWNDYLIPLAFTLSRKELRPLTVGVISLKDNAEGAASWNLMIAGAVLSIVPILIVYFFTNKYFISGMTEGAIKG